jgi:hypothetical protein
MTGRLVQCDACRRDATRNCDECSQGKAAQFDQLRADLERVDDEAQSLALLLWEVTENGSSRDVDAIARELVADRVTNAHARDLAGWHNEELDAMVAEQPYPDTSPEQRGTVWDLPEHSLAECRYCNEAIVLDLTEGGGPAKDWGAPSTPGEVTGLDYGCSGSPWTGDEGSGSHMPDPRTIAPAAA